MLMPRKKIDPQNNEPVVLPKRTRKASAVREQAPPAPSLERPRLMSATEKRQLILAHAANRRPVDAVQRFSLWTGVAVCILAIGVGWVYTMRQTIIGALETDAAASSQNQDVGYDQLRESMHGSINTIVDKIDTLQEKEIQELQRQAAIAKAMKAVAENMASGTDAGAAEAEEPDIFRPDGSIPPASDNLNSNQFQIPEGVTIESSN